MTAPPRRYGEDVRAEQVRTLYRQSLPVLVTNCINAGVLGFALWGTAPRALLVPWLCLMWALALARAALFVGFRRRNPAPGEARVWGLRFVIGSAASGVLWGGAALGLRYARGQLEELLVIFMVGGMCTAAAGTLAAYFAAFVAFLSPALLGLALGMVRFGDEPHQLMAGVIALYGAGLLAVARINHRALTEAFSLRVENAELVAELSRARGRLEENNRCLEQRVAERSEALQKQKEALRDARRLEAVGRLAGGVAHDFNNLLTIILASISELSARRTLDGAVHLALQEMRDACTKGVDLVRQLLTFGRRQRSNPETLDINEAIRRMDRLLGRLLGDQMTLELQLEPSPLFVRSDPIEIEQVIVNLVTNARDALPGSGSVTIESRALDLVEPLDGIPPGAYVLLGVADNGEGMDAETRRRIFEPFFTTKEVGKGTGLGLATVHGIVQQCGGHIRVHSTQGAGSAFNIYLPAAAPPPCSRPRELDSHQGRLPALAVRELRRGASVPGTVLLVEDEPTVRTVVKRILASAGHRVLVAASGDEALSLAAAHDGSIDLLLTDVVMPGFDGIELAGRLRAVEPGLRTLFISGYSPHSMPRDQPSAGIGFLPKPFTYDSLIAKVNELMIAPATREEAMDVRDLEGV